MQRYGTIASRGYVFSTDKQNLVVVKFNIRIKTLCLIITIACFSVRGPDSVPVLALESVGLRPVELERGGIFVLLLLLLAFGFFSMLRPNSGVRASELSSIKRGKQRVVAAAGQATKALIHFWQTRRPHYGDILTTNKPRENRETQSKCLS